MILRELGAIETIVRTIKTHIDHIGVCMNGYFALTNIAINGKQQFIAIKSD